MFYIYEIHETSKNIANIYKEELNFSYFLGYSYWFIYLCLVMCYKVIKQGIKDIKKEIKDDLAK